MSGGKCPGYLHCEVTTVQIPMLAWPFIAAFWIFMFWVLWIVAKSLRSLNEGIEKIANSLQSKS
jgi:hypothetical protein